MRILVVEHEKRRLILIVKPAPTHKIVKELQMTKLHLAVGGGRLPSPKDLPALTEDTSTLGVVGLDQNRNALTPDCGDGRSGG